MYYKSCPDMILTVISQSAHSFILNFFYIVFIKKTNQKPNRMLFQITFQVKVLLKMNAGSRITLNLLWWMRILSNTLFFQPLKIFQVHISFDPHIFQFLNKTKKMLITFTSLLRTSFKVKNEKLTTKRKRLDRR